MERFIPDTYQITCPMCQRVFISNHLNRRYCSKECKMMTNNKKARTIRKATQSLNNILIQNREILRGYKNGEIVKKLVLLGKGFNFAYHTHETLIESVKYICCYETAYQFTDSNKDKVKVLIFQYK